MSDGTISLRTRSMPVKQFSQSSVRLIRIKYKRLKMIHYAKDSQIVQNLDFNWARDITICNYKAFHVQFGSRYEASEGN